MIRLGIIADADYIGPHGLTCMDCEKQVVSGDEVAERLVGMVQEVPMVEIICGSCGRLAGEDGTGRVNPENGRRMNHVTEYQSKRSYRSLVNHLRIVHRYRVIEDKDDASQIHRWMHAHPVSVPSNGATDE